ncbi:hypothetical protein FZX09_04000 [Synechococcus sp. MU1643]|uniref:hypothetical protein n=1 Tax=Synechococcus sp. MU1643 TaxID=2508349 RepID=UPI001CF89F83|nr:hypothetical protein [Synechococcus sp. MU1643]MCB4427976.1 hypothetical protein [Synechococcus sp. MU1643]
MKLNLNTAFLGVIAAALTLPQIPAAYKAIHNNVIYRVQLAQYERAQEQYKEDVNAYCKEHSSVWVSRNKTDNQRAKDFWARNPGPQRADYPMTRLGTVQFQRALEDWRWQKPLGPSSIRRSVQGCIGALTKSSTPEIRNAYALHKQTPEFKGKRPSQI